MLKAFGALPGEKRARELKHRDYLWCALNLLLDEQEELERLCPACRAEAMAERCPVCGAEKGNWGENPAFDPQRFRELGGEGA